MRRVNSKRLNEWLKANGEDAKVLLHQKARVSMAWIDQAASGRYKYQPGRLVRSAVSSATGISEDELFPEAATKGKAS